MAAVYSSLLLCFIFCGAAVSALKNLCPKLSQCKCSRVEQDAAFMVDCNRNDMREFPDFSQLEQNETRIHLNMENNNIDDIGKSSSLSGYDIIMLDLGHNPLRYGMIDGVFNNNVPNLISLKLNNIHSLDLTRGPLVALRGLGKLQRLELLRWKGSNDDAHPDIRIQNALFEGLGLENLKELNLKNRAISWLSRNALKDLPMLGKLDLSFNRLSTVPTDVFSAVKGLRALQLNDNRIKYLGKNDFSTAENLWKLNLENNRIVELKAEVFSGLEMSLGDLNLAGNDITQFPTKAIENLQRLRDLDVSGNQIQRIVKDDLVGEHRLAILNIGGNPIRFFPTDMFDPVNATVVHLGFSNMVDKRKQFPSEALGHLTSLEKIDLSGGRLPLIPDSYFSGLPLSLRTMNMKNIGVRTIEGNPFRNLSLGLSITLDENELPSLDFMHNIPACTIRSLHVESNPLTCTCSLNDVIYSRNIGTMNGMCSTAQGVEYSFETQDLSKFMRDELSCPHVEVDDPGCWELWEKSTSAISLVSWTLLLSALISTRV